MPRYRVIGHLLTTAEVVVEAADEEEARDLATDDFENDGTGVEYMDINLWEIDGTPTEVAG